MLANLVCDPPLGQVTVRSATETTTVFTILVETADPPKGDNWEVVLWHEFHTQHHWTATPCEEINSTLSVFSVNESPHGGTRRRYFTAALQRGNNSSWAPRFTVKFRTNQSEAWRWVNDAYFLSDGQIIFQQPQMSDSTDLGTYIEDLNPDLNIKASKSSDPNQWSWSITAPVEAAKGRDSGYADIALGFPRDISRWFAIVRPWAAWLAPRHGKSKFLPDKDSILASFLRSDGLHVVLLPISGLDDTLTVLKADPSGRITISSRNDGTSEGTIRVLASVGRDFDSTMAFVVNRAREIMWQGQTIEGSAITAAETQKDGGVTPKWFEYWYDGLGYCTWNSLGRELSEERILDALEDLDKNNIKISSLIIDDNWQSLDENHRWMEFEANKNFPQGLKHMVGEIRGKYKHIQHIAVWHALMGYWDGISTKGKLNDTYKTIETSNGGNSIRVVDSTDVSRLYEDFYKFLWQCGIDSAKTDGQLWLDELVHADDRRRLTKAYQDAWIVSSLRWLSGKVIACMAQAPQLMFHTLLPSDKPRILARNSDDFFPDNGDSHTWHVFCNAHNSTFTSQLNTLPDWDMFQTLHPYASFHAAARCISGGPIYITDRPGKHNVDLIRQITARTSRGNTVILRPSLLGKTTEPYSGYEEERLLKVGNFNGVRGIGTSLLATFNVSQRSLIELIPLKSFPEICEDKEYIVRAHTTGEISEILPGDSSSKTSLVALDVPPRGWEFLSAYPVRSIQHGSGDRKEFLKIVNLGLLGKMTGAVAVLSTDIKTPDSSADKLRITIRLKALGVLGLYMSNLPSKSINDDLLILLLGRVIPLHTVRKNTKVPELLEVDVEKAWDEMGLSSAWNNEVTMQVYIN
ncbi:MAG: hypothetical protein M1839_006965 [Geoglossum umbratile]|nr:MAG: hypothetical protein M1839_006965 [Geoglossum umbratile]